MSPLTLDDLVRAAIGERIAYLQTEHARLTRAYAAARDAASRAREDLSDALVASNPPEWCGLASAIYAAPGACGVWVEWDDDFAGDFPSTIELEFDSYNRTYNPSRDHIGPTRGGRWRLPLLTVSPEIVAMFAAYKVLAKEESDLDRAVRKAEKDASDPAYAQQIETEIRSRLLSFVDPTVAIAVSEIARSPRLLGA